MANNRFKKRKEYFKDCWSDFETTINKDPFWKKKINVSRAELCYKKTGEFPPGFIPPEVYSWNVKVLLRDLMKVEYGTYTTGRINWRDRKVSFLPLFSFKKEYTVNDYRVFYKEKDWNKHVEITSLDFFRGMEDLEEKMKSEECYVDFVGLNIFSYLDFSYKRMCIGKYRDFFHNGGNFDAHFIVTQKNINYLNDKLRADHLTDVEISTDKDFLNELGKIRRPKNTMKTMVNKNKKIYDVTFKRDKGYWKISDNNLLFAGSIRGFGQELAKYYIKTDKSRTSEQWNEIYNKAELKGGYQRFYLYSSWEEFFADGNQLEYLCQDTYVLAEYQRFMAKSFPRKYWKMTAGSTAFNFWKGMFSEKLLREAIESKQVTQITLSRGLRIYNINKPKLQTGVSEVDTKKFLFEKYFGSQAMDWMTEKINGVYIWEYIKEHYYHGGKSWVNEDWVGKKLKDVFVFDYKSSYPTRLHSNAKLPYGTAIVGDTSNKAYDWKLYRIDLKHDMVIEKGYTAFIPFLKTNGNGTPQSLNWLKRLDAIRNGGGIYLCEPEYQHFLKLYKSASKFYTAEECYNVNVEFSFKSKSANYFFGEYIDYWFDIKERASKEHNGVMKAIAKLMLNSLYGKFGTNIERESNYWDNEQGQWVSYLSNSIEEQGLSYYLPFAIYTTAEARMALVDSIGDRDDEVIGGDTDSFIVSTKKGKDWLYDFDKMVPGVSEIENLGKADCENIEKCGGEAMTGVFRRSKQYGLWCGEKLVKFAYAGININSSPTEKEYDYDGYEIDKKNQDTVYKYIQPIDLIEGAPVPNQLESVKITNFGVLLCDTTKQISEIWDFEPRLEQYRYTKSNKNEYLRKDGWRY